MTYLSDLRSYRKIATKAVAQYPLTNSRINYIGFSENVVYKISANEGEFILRIHASNFRTKAAILEELAFLNLLRVQGDFSLQTPIATRSSQQVAEVSGKVISLLSWQNGRKKHKSIGDEHFKILGQYLAKLHNFSRKNKHNISNQHRDYWTPDNLIGEKAILGSFEGLENISGFNRQIFETCRKQVLTNLKQHVAENPKMQGMIHADLHFSNIVWRGTELLPIDFDDCGQGSFLHDLSIPIITMNSDRSQHHRNVLLNAYSNNRPLGQQDLANIDNYILARHIAMQGWLFARSNQPKIKQYHAKGMLKTMDILKQAIDNTV